MANKELIRKALDCFEDGKFTDAQEILKSEIKKHKSDWLTDRLGLKESEELSEEDDVDDDEDENEDED